MESARLRLEKSGRDGLRRVGGTREGTRRSARAAESGLNSAGCFFLDATRGIDMARAFETALSRHVYLFQ